MAIEQEFLGELDDAISSYARAKTTAQDYLGDDDVLAVNLDDVYVKAKAAIEAHLGKKGAKKSLAKSTIGPNK